MIFHHFRALDVQLLVHLRGLCCRRMSYIMQHLTLRVRSIKQKHEASPDAPSSLLVPAAVLLAAAVLFRRFAAVRPAGLSPECRVCHRSSATRQLLRHLANFVKLPSRRDAVGKVMTVVCFERRKSKDQSNRNPVYFNAMAKMQ